MGMRKGWGYVYLTIEEIYRGPITRPFELSLEHPETRDWSLSELGRPDLLNGKPVPLEWLRKDSPFAKVRYRVDDKQCNQVWLSMIEEKTDE